MTRESGLRVTVWWTDGTREEYLMSEAEAEDFLEQTGCAAPDGTPSGWLAATAGCVSLAQEDGSGWALNLRNAKGWAWEELR